MLRYPGFLILILIHVTALPGKPERSVYLDGGQSDTAVILAHGRGRYPTWKVVNPLRKKIHKKLGFHTLSLQMPADRNKKWRAYAADFPQAYKTIQAGIDFLRKEKGVKHIYLMGHSMGSRMATAYLANYPDHGIKGFIGVGIRNGGDDPLDSDANLRNIKIPVIDIYGDGGNGKDARHAETRSDMVSSRYKQVLIAGANHKFTGAVRKKMVKAVIHWLREQEKK